jgi:DNA polymerase-3 subunit gamma/tau
MLSQSAFNAFLKTLEEPPKYAIFILATTEKNKILPTILSRCQIFDFNRIQVRDISGHLAKIAQNENIEFEDEALRLIALKADGGLRDALSMFDRMVTFSLGSTLSYKTVIENLHILDYEYFFKITDLLFESNLSQVFLTFDEILRNGFDGHNFLIGLMEHLRNVLVSKDNSTIALLPVSDSVKQKYQTQANTVSMSFLVSALNICNNFDIHYKNSKNPRLHVELALMKMSHLKSALSLSQVLSDPEALKKKLV